jgi:hypothetical protein
MPTGLGYELIDESAIYHKGVATPQNTTANGSVVRSGAGGQNGACEVVLTPATAIGLADTKTLTITVQDSADGTSFATVDSFVRTASGATTLPAGTPVWKFVLPETIREYTRVQIATTDAAATGTVDVFLKYLAR